MSKSTPNGYLDRSAIFAADDTQYEDVDVPEWGGKVRVKSLRANERDAFEASLIAQKGRKTEMTLTNLRAKLAVMVIVDAEGKRLFADGDAAMLGERSADVVNRIVDVARRLSGMSETDAEELLGNSESGLTAASVSD